MSDKKTTSKDLSLEKLLWWWDTAFCPERSKIGSDFSFLSEEGKQAAKQIRQVIKENAELKQGIRLIAKKIDKIYEQCLKEGK